MKGRVLSGIRPTGKMHLGNLIGALKNWASLQEEYECFYMVADWHAFMSEYEDPSSINENIIDNVADWIACGIDPEKSTIFLQSEVSEHAELHLIFSCITPIRWLERCPTYKEQVKELGEGVANHGFLGYPVLQTADIALYKAEFVPVGEDQLPHLELAREIIRRFHSLYGKIFPEPQPILTKTPRLLGIDARKMSKSYGNVIELSEKEETIKKKVMEMFTDPLRIRRTDPGHPQSCNVFTYHRIFSKPERLENLEKECIQAEIGCTDCKRWLGDVLSNLLRPIQEKRQEILSKRERILLFIKEGSKKASKIAKETLKETKDAIFGRGRI
jgi:tryptophanyl-tRNA synthetase